MLEMFFLGVAMFTFLVLCDHYPKFKAFWFNLWDKIKTKLKGWTK